MSQLEQKIHSEAAAQRSACVGLVRARLWRWSGPALGACLAAIGVASLAERELVWPLGVGLVVAGLAFVVGRAGQEPLSHTAGVLLMFAGVFAALVDGAGAVSGALVVSGMVVILVTEGASYAEPGAARHAP